MELSFGQWVRLGFGATALMRKHADAVPALRSLLNDALDLWQSVVPPEAVATEQPDNAMPHHEVIEKIRTGDLSPAEKAVMDRASQSFG
jgi:hypothetical protein